MPAAAGSAGAHGDGKQTLSASPKRFSRRREADCLISLSPPSRFSLGRDTDTHGDGSQILAAAGDRATETADALESDSRRAARRCRLPPP